MEPSAHTPILKKTGAVLLAVGLLDIAVMIYCIVNRISYSSSFNIFAVAAGIFLLRGSMRAASAVRWFAVFMLAGFVALVFTWPFLQPLDLTLTQLRLNLTAALVVAAFTLGLLLLLYWLQRELGQSPVLVARALARRKVRNMRVPASMGVGMVLVLVVSLYFLLGGAPARKAISIAEQKLGSTYRYHVSLLSVAKSGQGTFVTAWNAQQVRSVPVEWKE